MSLPEQRVAGVFDQGVLTSNDLMMLSPIMSVTGESSSNLVEESIDYLLNPVLTGDTGVESLDALSGTTIPFRLTGNLYEPNFKVDIAAALIASQKDLIDQKANEIFSGLLGGKKKKKKKEDSADGGNDQS